ncbi:MAG: hypothetical protein GX128_03295 [Bacteroidales bacterium]|jgi:hypothetical protein|nr:hypothetical protein [Bacteroidales bacterium]
MKDRKKTISELAERIKAKENPGYIRIWSFKDGRPYLEDEGLSNDSLKVNLLESGGGELPNWKAFDLEAIANEPETRQRLTNHKITSEL